MRAAEVGDPLHERLLGLGCRGPAPLVGASDSDLPLLPKAGDQAADCARREAEFRGDGGDIVALLEAPPESLTEGDRNGTRHGKPSLRKVGKTVSPRVYARHETRPNFVSQLSAIPHVA
jgi:hypothetical protein